MIKIRKALAQDIDAMVEMGKAMHQESPRYRMLDYCEEKCQALGHSLLQNNGGLFLAEKWIKEESGKWSHELIGMMAGFVTPHFFGNDLMAYDLLCYVEKKHRGSSAAVRLIKAFKVWAFENGAKVISLGVSTEVDFEKTARFYEKLKFRNAGRLFVMEHSECGQ